MSWSAPTITSLDIHFKLGVFNRSCCNDKGPLSGCWQKKLRKTQLIAAYDT